MRAEKLVCGEVHASQRLWADPERMHLRAEVELIRKMRHYELWFA